MECWVKKDRRITWLKWWEAGIITPIPKESMFLSFKETFAAKVIKGTQQAAKK
jgi:hypothetical protein